MHENSDLRTSIHQGRSARHGEPAPAASGVRRDAGLAGRSRVRRSGQREARRPGAVPKNVFGGIPARVRLPAVLEPRPLEPGGHRELLVTRSSEVVRRVNFKMGLNLILDKPTASKTQSGNSVGKTTVLRLIDYCLGSDGNDIWQDSEFKKNVNKEVYDFLHGNQAIMDSTFALVREPTGSTHNRDTHPRAKYQPIQ